MNEHTDHLLSDLLRKCAALVRSKYGAAMGGLAGASKSLAPTIPPPTVAKPTGSGGSMTSMGSIAGMGSSVTPPNPMQTRVPRAGAPMASNTSVK
jgi:hypothetical protein